MQAACSILKQKKKWLPDQKLSETYLPEQMEHDITDLSGFQGRYTKTLYRNERNRNVLVVAALSPSNMVS